MKVRKLGLLGAFILSGIFPVGYAQNNIEKRVEDLLSKMTLEEKIGQMNQVSFFAVDDKAIAQYSDDDMDTFLIRMGIAGGQGQKKPSEMTKSEKIALIKAQAAKMLDNNITQPIRDGKIGSLLNITDPVMVNKLQKAAMDESRLGIPMIIGRDVIHGFKTIFPIPLGQAASFNPQMIEDGARIAAIEARSTGVNWTFAPMLDISRDARWGRIAESLGEDPYLGGQLGAAMVRGFQGNGNLADPNAIAACVKHFIGYGAAEGGRDYNSTNIPPHLMRNIYLPPFHNSIKAGAATLMTSFNDNDGIPASGNSYILKNILRDEWKFDGFVVSDWASIGEMIAHGFAKDDKQAAEISANAGLDMEMVTGAYLKYLPELIKEGKVSMATVDNAVRNILRIKFRLGLFENPYVDTNKASVMYADAHMKAARQAAVESAILLKNDNNTLPLAESKKIAVIGPMANAPHDQLGTWIFDGDKNHTVTPIGALKEDYKHIRYVYEPALAFSREKNTANFEKAKQAAASADVAVVFLGEESILSGEAHSLSNINLIGVQSELLKAVKSTGKPVVLVIMAGRPLTIERDLPFADAVLFNFHPGTMGGPAIFDLLFGKANPSGKLPATFVREVGQIPMYYNHNNTGRPAPEKVMGLDEIELEAGQTSLGNTSFYLDSGKDPLYPFGYGLSYSMFEYSGLTLSSASIPMNGTLTARVTLKNTSNVDGTEVAQLYIQDIVGSVVRPVRELKGFQRVALKAGESKIIEFKLSADDLAFYGRDLIKRTEAGDFNIWIGGDSNAPLKSTFSVTE
ncbi:MULTISPECIES: beta-glucosidase BglX [unclassified Dysgonomonas]|jgi:beta-glucosidase|uniref:beta-glucosidase BglX n=1 Tax=unclassified Dysgonomonas TaxID=2630389 RepID=UPI0025C37A4B|nr:MULTISPECIES: beta-glucosidase BglX [unclassified Dysgonomonas]MDR2001944.1 beta-glucosidase BglX [Prevotella sp.]HMM02430.1 beta-glucosidase BglX [Dysgonomonas sp.]